MSNYIIYNGQLYVYPDYLKHYGVKGMKWGVRKEYEPHPREKSSKVEEPSSEKKKKGLTDKQKKYIKIGAAVVGAALVAYVSVLGGSSIAYNRHAINKYKKEHPNTRLSDKEIFDLISSK